MDSRIRINSQKLQRIEIDTRRAELKKLLSDSDWRMTYDFFNSMSKQEQKEWTNKRKQWREELDTLKKLQIE